MRSRKRKLNVFQQIIWQNVFYQLNIHIGKPLLKCIFCLSAVIIGVYLSYVIPTVVGDTVHEVIAAHDAAEAIKLQEKQEVIRREELARKRHQEEVDFLKMQEEKRIIKLAEMKQKEIDEMLEVIHIGDWVEITWWGSEYGHVPPRNNFATGQITSISEFDIKGTWGDCVINWKNHPHFERLSQKQYSEKRRREEKQLAKQLAKTEKTKFKSWGTLPGTVKSVNGVDYISVVENNKIVLKKKVK